MQFYLLPHGCPVSQCHLFKVHLFTCICDATFIIAKFAYMYFWNFLLCFNDWSIYNACIIGLMIPLLKIFLFLNKFGLKKELENSMESFCIPFTQLPLMLTSYIIIKTKKLTYWHSTVNYILFYLKRLCIVF